MGRQYILVAENMLLPMYNKWQEGVTMSRLLKDSELSITLPTLSKLLKDIELLKKNQNCKPDYLVINNSLFPKWAQLLAIDIIYPAEYGYHYEGKRPWGKWILDQHN